MTVLADAGRNSDLNLALFTHVLGALLLTGAVTTVVIVLYAGWRTTVAGDAVAYARLAFRTLLFVALPAWIVTWTGAWWIYDKEHLGDLDDDPTWVGLGWIAAEPGAVILLITIVLAGLSARRLRLGGGTMGTLGKVTTVLATILLVAYVVAIWAMGAKPS